ncbi:GNAT family N-acyltransferase [Pantoea sp. 1.19]|uniref:GNAT family N-acyltransferase n=1 Tax=Pantoea sp. 1.19 TaxID=1925589 RepID=UPI0009491246|nr:GNAT family N-acyltransferase [Pantoea sp. 1.19]
MKIIQTQFKDMPSSLIAELGSYRYSVFTRGEGWSIPQRLYTPGQEYDRFDRSDVHWLIAWHPEHGICGCARLMAWREPPAQALQGVSHTLVAGKTLELSRFSAQLSVSQELPMQLLWHALQIAEIDGNTALITAATPMLEQMFDAHQVVWSPLTPGLLQSEETLFAVQIPVMQSALASRYRGARRFTPAEVLPSLGVMTHWRTHGR